MAQHHHRYALRSHARRERSSFSSSSPSPRHKAPRTSSLPVDLLRNVLSRLPTISLLKLRSVCREWRDIIDDPHFAAMHARSGVESPRILLLSGPRHGRGADPQFAVDDRFLSLPILAMGRWLRTSRASCHGLHCFEDLRHGVTYIVNPLTREFISLKNVEPSPWQRIGIGFDRQTGRYKIVRVSYSMDCVVFPLRAAVLDQGSRSWRDIPSVPSSLDLDEGPVFAAGSIHWKTNGRGGTLGVGIRISSFDLTQEEFGWTPCPALRDAHLVDLQGVLGLVDCSRKESMDVWAMEEGGRWTKEYSVRLISPLPAMSPWRIDALGCGGRKIALVYRESVWFHDPATGELEYVRRPGGRRDRPIRSIRDREYVQRRRWNGAIEQDRVIRSITVSLLSPQKLWNGFC